MTTNVQIHRLRPDVPIPEYKTPGAVAFDIAVPDEAVIEPGETKFLPTGLVVCVPEGHALILASRSSNAKKGIMLANSIGIIDQDYCGPEDQLHLAVYNLGKEPYTVEAGERIAQALIVPITRAKFEDVDELSAPNRGGYGTTG